ncbi:MAG: NAD-dependent DNA ligase LigA [Candidatus Omnitrophica bacterium]|nr:NAD-dependent DNA ligase LigA [Candidatus Omnitrophota bacterium]
MGDVKARIDELREEIKRHNDLYYTKGKPIVSDAEYDKRLKELKKLEKEHPEYASSDSPTQKVGAPVPVRDKFKKVKHTSPMLSLDSINEEEEFDKFDKTCKKELEVEAIEYLLEPKLDGLSVEIVYEKGEFARASTRGDGLIGEDVTENVKTIKTLPKKLKGDKVPDMLALRGEVMMHISAFQRLNKKQIELGEEPFANPRNAAAGSLRQLDVAITSGRELDVYVYQILAISGKLPDTQKGSVDLIKGLGLKTAPDVRCLNLTDDVIKYHRDMEKRRDSLDYEIDGVVIKVDRVDFQNRLGMRTTSPKWAVAYKFEARKEMTRVDDIAVQVGRTGILTPVALLQPVDVGGVTVSRASLHNMDEVDRLGVMIGDQVRIERAGDVIPKVIEVIKDKRTGAEREFKMPEVCPSCGTKLVKEDVFYRCPAGFACRAQIREAITHFVSKGAFDIEGFSEKTAEQLLENGLIEDVAGIYKLEANDLMTLDGWKQKKTENILNAIEKAKNVTLDRFIYALGIRNVGSHISALLAEKFTSLEKFMQSKEEELMEIKEIGPEIAESITSFFEEKNNRNVIQKLIAHGVKIKKYEKAAGKLEGKKFVFTGTLSAMSRGEAEKRIESMGGEAQSNVTKDTDYVVVGENPGSKATDAQKKDIKILREAEFLKLLSS